MDVDIGVDVNGRDQSTFGKIMSSREESSSTSDVTALASFGCGQ